MQVLRRRRDHDLACLRWQDAFCLYRWNLRATAVLSASPGNPTLPMPPKRQWHSSFVDLLRRRLPSDSFIRPHAKQLVEDARSLLNTGRDWTFREKLPPATLHLETT